MDWQIFIAMVVAIPVILLPVAFLWYLNIDDIFDTVKSNLTNREKVRKNRNK